MRISTDPTDPAYIDERPRRVWLNNVEVLRWIVADEFRRCVIAPGKHEGDTVVMHGSVLIERLGEPGAEVVAPPAECSTSLAGMFVPVPKAAVEVVEAPAPTFAVPTVPVKAAPIYQPSDLMRQAPEVIYQAPEVAAAAPEVSRKANQPKRRNKRSR